MGLPFRKLKKLWILYLFLLFFAFFMFAISINVYLQSLQSADLRKRNWESHRNLREKSRKNVIVANYIGTGNIFGNMSKDDYNKNNFLPVESEGAMGRPVLIPAHETLIMQRMFQVNRFNLLASDRIPLNRTLNDYRTKECAAKNYDSNLPSTSVVIVFHNEAWSVLLRTVWSVINRSPKHLIKEILLVDDASGRDFLKADLDNYVATLPIYTKVLRLKERSGLVPARLLGAKRAKGEVLTFLDAHCECSPGWLEPLLFRVQENPKSVVCPVIDIISDDTFSYTKTFENHWGAFNWQLHFRWYVLSKVQLEKRKEDITKAIPTPAMAGGLFSIKRDYFFEMGAYDKNMKIWGGENVEMSFRIWQCGGSVEISPCSHVGHLFRKSSPYTFPGGVNDVLNTNLARAALVWMDEWADFFFMYNPIDPKIKNSIDVTERKLLRKRLNCKPFRWYLENVWPNNFFPEEKKLFAKIVLLNGQTTLANNYEKYIYRIPGRLVQHTWVSLFQVLLKTSDILLSELNLNRDFCLRANVGNSSHTTYLLSSAIVGNCTADVKLQDMFVITPKGQIMTNENICLDCYQAKNNMTSVRFFHCTDNERQVWEYDINSLEIRHSVLKLCLTADEKAKGEHMSIKVDFCRGDKMQKWGFVPLVWKF